MTQGQAAVYDPLYAQSPVQLQVTLQQLAPLVYADTLTISSQMFQSTTSVIDDEMRARRGGVEAPGTQSAAGPHDSTIWVIGTGNFVTLDDAKNGTPGFHGSSGGSIFGIDHALAANSRIGLAGAFGSQSFSTSNSASYSGQSAQLVAYGSVMNGPVFLDGQFGGMFNQGTAQRTLTGYGLAAKGDVSQSGVGASVRTGVRTELAGWGFEPTAGFRLLSLQQASVSESYAGAVGMNIAPRSITSARALLAMDVDRRIQLSAGYALVTSAQVGIAHEMASTNAPVTASFSGLPGSNLAMSNPSSGRSDLTLGFDAELKTATRLSVFASYGTSISTGSTSQQVIGGVRYSW
jgi:fibronectin-binding autotransporter adhesin